MRTLTENQRLFWQRITDRVCGESRYDVEGALTFVFDDHTVEPDLAQLAKAICKVDSRFPWRGDGLPGGHKGLGLMLIPNVITHNWSVPEKVCWYSLAHLRLRKSQWYAYEKYLDTLADELAKLHLPNVNDVRSVTQITGVRYHKVV